MNDVFTLEKKEICLLDKTEQDKTCYGFYVISTQGGADYYAVEAHDGGEGDMQIIGKDADVCRRIYRSIAEGGVSALHLAEVVRDILTEVLY